MRIQIKVESGNIAHVHTDVRDDKGVKDRLKAVDGIEDVFNTHTHYSITVFKGQVFTWDEVLPNVIAAVAGGREHTVTVTRPEQTLPPGSMGGYRQPMPPGFFYTMPPVPLGGKNGYWAERESWKGPLLATPPCDPYKGIRDTLARLEAELGLNMTQVTNGSGAIPAAPVTVEQMLAGVMGFWPAEKVAAFRRQMAEEREYLADAKDASKKPLLGPFLITAEEYSGARAPAKPAAVPEAGLTPTHEKTWGFLDRVERQDSADEPVLKTDTPADVHTLAISNGVLIGTPPADEPTLKIEAAERFAVGNAAGFVVALPPVTAEPAAQPETTPPPAEEPSASEKAAIKFREWF